MITFDLTQNICTDNKKEIQYNIVRVDNPQNNTVHI